MAQPHARHRFGPKARAAPPPAAAPPPPAAAPARLDDQWRRWIAENFLLGTAPEAIAERLVRRGAPPALAAAEVEAAVNSPYLRGAEVLQNRLAKRDWLLWLEARHQAADPGLGAVPRLDSPSPDAFQRLCWGAGRPALIGGWLDDWPARRWTPERLRALPADTMVEVQMGREANADYEAQCLDHRKRVPLERLLLMLAQDRPTNDFYVTANNSGHNRAALGPLWEDLGDIPGVLRPGAARAEGFVWIGPRGTITPWHHDLTNNLLVQFHGTKRVRLVSAAQTPLMRNQLHCYSAFALDGDCAAAPDAARPRILTVDLGPGEALYIPVGWWHHVEGRTMTMGASFTGFVWPNDFGQAYTTFDQV
jgi:hypothetical protein